MNDQIWKEMIAADAYNENIIVAIFGMKEFELHDIGNDKYTYLHTTSGHFVYIKCSYKKYSGNKFSVIDYISVESEHIFDNNENATKLINASEFVLKLGKELSKKL